jgi:hypothetical protein
MKDLVTHYWYVGALFSALYTIGSAWWTVQAERRFRALKREQRILMWGIADKHERLEQIESFLENGNTLREIKVIPLHKKVTQ